MKGLPRGDLLRLAQRTSGPKVHQGKVGGEDGVRVLLRYPLLRGSLGGMALTPPNKGT